MSICVAIADCFTRKTLVFLPFIAQQFNRVFRAFKLTVLKNVNIQIGIKLPNIDIFSQVFTVMYVACFASKI